MSDQKPLIDKNQNKDKLADIDCKLLADRLDYCTMIHQEIEDIFVKSLVKSGIIKSKDFEFAGVKGIPRSKQKLLQYLDKKGEFDIETALYELKDLLRG